MEGVEKTNKGMCVLFGLVFSMFSRARSIQFTQQKHWCCVSESTMMRLQKLD
jgi:hypothetical protein